VGAAPSSEQLTGNVADIYKIDLIPIISLRKCKLLANEGARSFK